MSVQSEATTVAVKQARYFDSTWCTCRANHMPRLDFAETSLAPPSRFDARVMGPPGLTVRIGIFAPTVGRYWD